jgi:hypothetical protein
VWNRRQRETLPLRVGKSLSRLGNRNLIDFAVTESKRCTRLKNRPPPDLPLKGEEKKETKKQK